jgi:hypothetical protein
MRGRHREVTALQRDVATMHQAAIILDGLGTRHMSDIIRAVALAVATIEDTPESFNERMRWTPVVAQVVTLSRDVTASARLSTDAIEPGDAIDLDALRSQ